MSHHPPECSVPDQLPPKIGDSVGALDGNMGPPTADLPPINRHCHNSWGGLTNYPNFIAGGNHSRCIIDPLRIKLLSYIVAGQPHLIP